MEQTMTLCGNNQELYNYGLQIVTNEKILGEAANCIRQLQNNPSWNNIKEKLRQHFKPSQSYSDEFNSCRNIKVSNLQELFDTFFNSSNTINDIYENDETKPEIYTSVNVDRDLSI